MTALFTITDPPAALLVGCDYDLADDERYSYDALLGMNESERNALGVATPRDPDPVGPYQRAISETVALLDGLPTYVREVEDITLHERKMEKLALLADIRWQRETGGMGFGMAQVATDDRSKLLAFAARTKAKEDEGYSRRWKVANGQYIDLDAPMLIALAEAIEAHVAACFEHEEAIATQIQAAGDHEALDAINLETGWPE